MKRLVAFCILLLFIGYINAQVVENPVFDRTDAFKFHVSKIALSKDTTFVYCSYGAEELSWANMSDKTFLEDVRNGNRYPILKISGLPFSPEKRHFAEAEDIQVILYFPPIATDKINIIENEEEEAFNIYGIDLNRSYTSSYTSEDIHKYYTAYEKAKEVKNWHSALEFTQKQLEATNYVEGIQSFASACSMYNMIMVYFDLEEYEHVIEWGKKAIDILRELSQDSIYLDVLARTYGNVGTAYQLLEEHEVATEFMELSLATRHLKDGVGALNYEEYLSEMARRYYYEGNYPKALLYGKEIVDIYEIKYCEKPFKYECVYINALNNLCEYYQKMGKSKDAVNTGKRALELIDRGGCNDYAWLKPTTYNNLGGALVNNGKIDEGINLLETALTVAEREKCNDEDVLLSTRLQLASTYLYYKRDTLKALNEYQSILPQTEDSIAVGKRFNTYITILEKLYEINRWANPDTALQYLNKAIKVQKEWNGDNSIAYANLLLEKIRNMWVPSLTEKKDLDSLLYYLCQSTNIIKRHLVNSSYNMSKEERRAYWQRYKEYFTWLIPTISGITNSKEGNALAYDAALFYKGMLLNSEKEFKNAIAESKDEILINKYQEYTGHLSLLEKLYSFGGSKHNVDSLTTIIQDEEHFLSQKVTHFNRQCKGSYYSWKEIKGQLNKKDVAIEILSYRSLDGKDTYYDGYIVKGDSDAPQLIYLFSENDLKELITDSVNYEGLSIILWGNEKIQDALKGIQNIYFSASGLLNNIGIEYLPIAGGLHIYDKFNLYRLSSTRELCMQDDKFKIEKVCLFGGLDYNQKLDKDSSMDTYHIKLSRSIVENLAKRGDFELLNGSKQEVEEVCSIMSKNKIVCFLFTDQEGTEDTFKNLSQSSVNILHLSTHGMFVANNNEKSEQNRNFHFIISDETSYIGEEEMSLSRSFLVLAGGNALIHGEITSANAEDGILTALEISHLDFNNLDMVVLSACETGLGNINTEGVYGLQRGFKKAGAKTILMSLDKVDDEATRILMVEFYRNLMSGKTKRQSLLDAQQYLRKVDNGKYDDPKYWASFIMLDGLN